MVKFFNDKLFREKNNTFNKNENLDDVISKVNEIYYGDSEKTNFSFVIDNKYNKEALVEKILSLLEKDGREGFFEVYIDNEPTVHKVKIEWGFISYGLRKSDLNSNYVYLVKYLLDNVEDYASVGVNKYNKTFNWDDFFEGFTGKEIDELDTEEVEHYIKKVQVCLNRLELDYKIYLNEHDEIYVEVKW